MSTTPCWTLVDADGEPLQAFDYVASPCFPSEDRARSGRIVHPEWANGRPALRPAPCASLRCPLCGRAFGDVIQDVHMDTRRDIETMALRAGWRIGADIAALLGSGCDLP